MKVLDVPIESSPAAPAARDHAGSSRWDGTESVWVQAAWAAAPWPLGCLVAAIGIPGEDASPGWLHGGLALAVLFGAMVVWTHRPAGSVLVARWIPTVVGTGLMAELLANALTDMGREPGLSGLAPFSRALSVWLICAGVYEVAPMLAAASRVSAREHRVRSLDVCAHALFVLMALAVYAWPPSWNGWYLSPWIAVLVTLPLTVVRSGPRRGASLPFPLPREGALWGLALVAWLLFALFLAGDFDAIADVARQTWRRGADPLEGVLWALPSLSLVLSLVAAAHLLVRAMLARRAPTGTVTAVGDGGVTLELSGQREPTWVALESGPLPAEGAVVTLLGVRDRTSDVGPFRDGAPRLSARRAWSGPPRLLAHALTHRAAGWLVWAAASEIGLWLRVL